MFKSIIYIYNDNDNKKKYIKIKIIIIIIIIIMFRLSIICQFSKGVKNYFYNPMYCMYSDYFNFLSEYSLH